MSTENKNWEYADAVEGTGHIKLKEKYGLYINGEWVAPRSKTYFSSTNPHDEAHLAEVAQANKQDVDAAVIAAERAYHDVWSKITPAERRKIYFSNCKINARTSERIGSHRIIRFWKAH